MIEENGELPFDAPDPQKRAITANNLSISASELDEDFRPIAGSPAIDGGVIVDGITDVYNGNAPDIGALESDEEPFTFGATWQLE